MQQLESRPLFTQVFDSFDAFVPDAQSAYFYATSGERRSMHSPDWEAQAANVRFLAIMEESREEVVLSDSQGVEERLALRSSRALLQMWSKLSEEVVYVDFTGLPHHVWAPLIRFALAAGKTVRAVYVEPEEYKRSASPREGEIFDLSDEIAGLAPLPGFASLGGEDDDAIFVPLLGFEGTRLAYLLEQVQPLGNRVFPIVGVPGFRVEYPFFTYVGNRPALTESKAWRNVRYARANCPFSALYALADLASEQPGAVIKVAPIGTKPHALGAVLFYLTSSRQVELIYDHPTRSSNRTAGSGRVSVFHISSLNIEPSRAVGGGRS